MSERQHEPEIILRLATDAEPVDLLGAIADLLIDLNDAEPRKNLALLEQHKVVAGPASSCPDACASNPE